MGNSHRTKVKAAPLSLDLSRDDYDMERRVTLFLSTILQLNSCHTTINLFLMDPLGLSVFKKFIRKSVSAEEADMFIEVDLHFVCCCTSLVFNGLVFYLYNFHLNRL